MCRLYAHRATLPLPVAAALVDDPHSLLHQSCGDRRGEKHGDGWGVGYFANDEPQLIRRPTAAAESPEFREVAHRVTSPTVLAHVRQASVGERLSANTHPFAFGRWLFMHNGTVTGFKHVRPSLLEETDPELGRRIAGTTDSEHVFFWLLSRLVRAGENAAGPCVDLRRTAEVLAESIRILDARSQATHPAEHSRLNFVFSDGRVLLASRFKHGLHWCRPLEKSPAGGNGKESAIAIASEPIGERAWNEVPDAHVLAIDSALEVHLSAI